MYREYWKLKGLHKLNLVCEELGDEGIGDFLKLCKLAKKEGYSREQVVKILQLVDEDNSSGILQLEKRHKWLIDKIHEFDLQIEKSKNYLYSLSNEIANARKLLGDYNISV